MSSGQLSRIATQCRLLLVSRTDYLQWWRRPPSARAQANARLDAQVAVNERRQADLVCQALQAAYWRRKPGPGLILHSDRGSQYASDRYRKLLADFRMLRSMRRRANC